MNGECCPIGLVDACGICNGTGIITDVYGQCCPIPLTSAGLCCTQGLDDCGVCGGTNACKYEATITLFTNASIAITDPAQLEAARSVPGLLPCSIVG
jgi:hypothetical protein